MIIGNTYIAFRPSEKIDLDGSIIEFSEEKYLVIILDKPIHVLSDDGFTTIVEALPDHLSKSEWLWVENLSKGINHWLNTNVYKLFSSEQLREIV